MRSPINIDVKNVQLPHFAIKSKTNCEFMKSWMNWMNWNVLRLIIYFLVLTFSLNLKYRLRANYKYYYKFC